MVRWCLIIITCFPLLARAQKFSRADVGRLRSYCTGIFLNKEPVNAVMPLTLRIQRIWPKRNDGLWLLTERTDTNHCSQVWHFYIQDDSTLVMQFLVFRAEEKTLQQGKDNMQAPVIRMNNLLTRGGCERYLKKTRTGYVGRSAGKDCLADKTGTDYFTCDMEFTRNTLIWQETRFNKDNEKKGSETFHFVKQANSLK